MKTDFSYAFVALLAIFLLLPSTAMSQRGSSPSPQSPQEVAPSEMAGYWVSVVNEDWRWRMVTPAKGDYAGIPLNQSGLSAADQWSPEIDIPVGEECRAFGAPGIMRVPGRIHMDWIDGRTLQIRTDAGMQTRLLIFGGQPEPNHSSSWQGYSSAKWEDPPGGEVEVPRFSFGVTFRGEAARSSLEVSTTHLRPGYLRWNGVPYSDKTILTEYFDIMTQPTGTTWLVVTTIVEDPVYLRVPYVTTTHFRKQEDDSGWNPTPCTTKW